MSQAAQIRAAAQQIAAERMREGNSAQREEKSQSICNPPLVVDGKQLEVLERDPYGLSEQDKKTVYEIAGMDFVQTGVEKTLRELLQDE